MQVILTGKFLSMRKVRSKKDNSEVRLADIYDGKESITVRNVPDMSSLEFGEEISIPVRLSVYNNELYCNMVHEGE